MAETEVITSFICLLSYAEPVPIGQVLLAEAVCACLFNTFDSDLYRDIRLQCLPRVDMSHGLNRSDPLRTLPVGPKSIGNDVTTFRRLRTLLQCNFVCHVLATVLEMLKGTLNDDNKNMPAIYECYLC